MPHITLQVPSSLKNAVDWNELFKNLHRKLANAGYGRLDDFKSRTITLDYWQVADRNEDALLLYATLDTMNPRPAEMIRAMGAMICEALEDKAREISNGRWLQVCVKVGGTPAEDYFKVHLNAPELKPGNFKTGETG
jgi:5-carboxymethyl-2-hydroxymuconate isomerase